MAGTLTANSAVVIRSEPAEVWEVITNPALLSKAFFGAKVVTNWREGSAITFSGEWNGKPYKDRGTIMKVVPNRLLEYTHWSPLSGTPDEPENYHTVTFELTPSEGGTELALRQSNVNDENEREHSEKTWSLMLGNIKKLVKS
jgi:uncharacterized protein YndB with AHSA1/START domain